MIKKLSLFALVVSVMAVSSAKADPILNYNFLEADYVWTHFDESNLKDSNGLKADISFSPIENFFIEGGYDYVSSKTKTNLGSHGVNIDTYKYGVGGFFPLQEKTHLVGRISGYHTDGRADSNNASDDGLGLGAAIRAALSPEFELEPLINYINYSEGNFWDYGVKGLYALNQDVGLDGGIVLNDDKDLRLIAGARYAW